MKKWACLQMRIEYEMASCVRPGQLRVGVAGFLRRAHALKADVAPAGSRSLVRPRSWVHAYLDVADARWAGRRWLLSTRGRHTGLLGVR